MMDSILKIESYTKNIQLNEFVENSMIVDAVVRNFEIIGEAASKTSESYRINFPNVEWRRIIGLRHRIVHEYFGIDFEILWDIRTNYLPILKNELSRIQG
jgi:uncharacterized protein with HEPN domain